MSELKNFVDLVAEEEKLGASFINVPTPLALAAKRTVERVIERARKGGSTRHMGLKTDPRAIQRRRQQQAYRERKRLAEMEALKGDD